MSNVFWWYVSFYCIPDFILSSIDITLGTDFYGRRVFVMIPALLSTDEDKELVKQYILNKFDPYV